jgi:hypothetical protein
MEKANAESGQIYDITKCMKQERSGSDSIRLFENIPAELQRVTVRFRH